ncbi:MAG: hypothetical protein BMS9Abin01_2309 [Gammaproteobacteria bacterium]|nr:MAG: hypothetical protein BMS9Abin01_2309 [Gammaproteobacteria bacterium]
MGVQKMVRLDGNGGGSYRYWRRGWSPPKPPTRLMTPAASREAVGVGLVPTRREAGFSLPAPRPGSPEPCHVRATLILPERLHHGSVPRRWLTLIRGKESSRWKTSGPPQRSGWRSTGSRVNGRSSGVDAEVTHVANQLRPGQFRASPNSSPNAVAKPVLRIGHRPHALSQHSVSRAGGRHAAGNVRSARLLS